MLGESGGMSGAQIGGFVAGSAVLTAGLALLVSWPARALGEGGAPLLSGSEKHV